MFDVVSFFVPTLYSRDPKSLAVCMPFTGKPEAEYVGAHLVSGFKILAAAAQAGEFFKSIYQIDMGFRFTREGVKENTLGKKRLLGFLN